MDGINHDIRYQSLLENTTDLILVLQDNKIAFANQKPLADLGYSINEVSHKNIFDFIYVDDREKVIEYQVKRAREEAWPDDLIFRIATKTGRLVFVKIISMATAWEGKPARLVCVKNITDHKLNALTIKNAEPLLYAIINHLPDPTFVIDVNGKMYLWNKALEVLSQVKAQDIVGKGDYEKAVPFQGYNGRVLIDLMLKSDAENEKAYDSFHRTEEALIAGRFLTATDKNRQVWVTSSLLYDMQGHILGAVESFRDLTDMLNAEDRLKAAIKEKEILLKEIHHRVRNNMQLINSLLSIQLRYVKDPESVDLFKDSVNRIKTMALIHDGLYQYPLYADINFRELIPKLMDNLGAMYKRPEITMQFEAEEIHLGIDDAIPCGLILNELVSNSLTHAFPEGGPGTIQVKFYYDKRARLCHLIVRDDGKGLPPGYDLTTDMTSFGLVMVNLLSAQLKGTVRLQAGAGTGTEISIAFPIKIQTDAAAPA